MRKKEKTLLVIMTLALILIVGTLTYAFFSAGVSNENKQEASITTGDMKLTFEDGSPTFSAAELTPGASVTKTFTIENTGSKVATARLKWKDLINSYLPESLSFILEFSETQNSGYQIVELGNVPQSLTKKTDVLYENIYVPANTKLYYNLTITLENLEDVDQTADLDSSMSSYFELEATHYDALTSVSDEYLHENFLGGNTPLWLYEAVYTVDYINVPEDALYSWDVSYLQNGSVMAWDMDIDDDGDFELYIGQEGGVIANPDSSHLFGEFQGNTMDLSNLNTSKVYNMLGMFESAIISDFIWGNFDTSNVINMKWMFYDSKLNNLNTFVSTFDTSKVTDMSNMFMTTTNNNLDLSNFDTSNVIDMSYMFCEGDFLGDLDLSNFDTSKLKFAEGIFDFFNVKNLNLTSWDFRSDVLNNSNIFHMGYVREVESITVSSHSESYIREILNEVGIETEIIVTS